MISDKFNTVPQRTSEADEQALLFRWAELNAGRLPELALMFHIPNGGSRNKIEAAHLKLQGVKPGVPDICVPVAHGRFHGMFIEMKAARGRVSDTQSEWLGRLNNSGYHAVVCFGFDDARREIMAYFSL